MLTAHELAKIRATALGSLPDVCTITTASLAADGQGGVIETWGTAASSVPCKLSPTILQEDSSEGGQWVMHSTWLLHVPYDQAIETGDRVLFSGETYDVLLVEDDQSYRSARRATLKRIDR